MFKVNIGYDRLGRERNKCFASLEEAKQFVGEVFQRTGRVLSIVEVKQTPKQRLEYLRNQLRAERISWDEVTELQSLADYIKPDDVELLEAACVSEWI